MPKVRVTNFDHPIDVDDAEIPSLRSQGLLIETLSAEEVRAELVAARDAAVAEVARLDAELAKTEPPAVPAAKQPVKGAKKES